MMSMRIHEIITAEAYDALKAQSDSIKKQQKVLKVRAANLKVQRAQNAANKVKQAKPR